MSSTTSPAHAPEATAAASGASATERFHADKSPYAAVKDVPAERVATRSAASRYGRRAAYSTTSDRPIR